MALRQFVYVLSFLMLAGCGKHPDPVNPSVNQNELVPSSDSDEILTELRKQNELLEAQAEREKERDAAQTKSRERDEHIDEIAGQVAKIVDEHQQDIGRAINDAGGSASERSLYNSLYSELRTLIRTEALPIEDGKAFRAMVMETSRVWASRKTGLDIPKTTPGR